MIALAPLPRSFNVPQGRTATAGENESIRIVRRLSQLSSNAPKKKPTRRSTGATACGTSWELPSQFAIATAVNAINGLRRLPAATSVARLVPLGQLQFGCPTEVISAVIHVTLLVGLDVAHLLSLITLVALESSTIATDLGAKRSIRIRTMTPTLSTPPRVAFL